ncbi:MAG: EthD family reductase [Gammaproteobacteria bacterium]
MFKIVGIIKRPAGMDFEAFKAWWLTEHAPRVQAWPGLVRYSINLATTPDQPFDGMAEVWFENRAAMEAVFETEAGRRARESATATASSIAILMTEEHRIVE